MRTAALAPTAYIPKAATTVPKSVTAPRKEDERPPPAPLPRGLSDEQEQALLIEKSLIAVAYAKRQQEANPLWTCMHESGKPFWNDCLPLSCIQVPHGFASC